MQSSSLTESEVKRLDAVKSLGLLDTAAEERFDRYTRLAQRVFDVPVALISLLDEERQWFKSHQGTRRREIPRNISFCDHTIRNHDLMVVADATQDPRFRDSPLVKSESGFQFYAGCPIVTRRGDAIGTFCIADHRPREMKPADLSLLRDLAGLVQDEIIVHNLATIDDLTGLSNRRGFLAISGHAIAMCRRMVKPATLMFFDLDGFKKVNDNYGHAEGDRVLVEVSQILLKLFRHSDVISRLGGDEFCVLLTGTEADSVARPLENLDNMIRKENDLHPYHIGYSVGTVTFDSERHLSIEDLLMEADESMYAHKREKPVKA